MGLRSINPIDIFARRVTATMAVTVSDIWNQTPLASAEQDDSSIGGPPFSTGVL